MDRVRSTRRFVDGEFGVLGGLLSVSILAVAQLDSLKVGLGMFAAIVTLALAIANPKRFTMWAIPFAELVPPVLHIPTPLPLTIPRIVVALAAVGWLVRGVQPSTRRMSPKFVALGVIFVLYVFSDSLISGGGTTISRGLSYSAEPLLTVWLMWLAVHTKDDVLKMMDILIGVMSIAALLALYESATHHYLIPADEPLFFHAPDRNGALRAQGIFPHPLVFGAALSLVLPLAIMRVFEVRNKLLPLAACAVFAGALLATGSRGPWAAAVVAVVVLATLLRGGRRATIITALVCVAVAVGFSPLGGKVGTALQGLVNAQSGQAAGVYTVQYRQELLSQTVAYTSSHPLGTGPGLSGNLSFIALVGGNNTNLAESIDNAFAKYGVELGWVGLLLFLPLLLIPLVAAFSGRRDPSLGGVASALIAAQVAMVVVSFTVATFSWEQLSELFWTITALGFVVWQLSAVRGAEHHAEVSVQHAPPLSPRCDPSPPVPLARIPRAVRPVPVPVLPNRPGSQLAPPGSTRSVRTHPSSRGVPRWDRP